MDAEQKTKNLRREFLPVGVLAPNPVNPNVMADSEFNMLVDNIQKVGITDPIIVRQLDEGKYRVVGGHHRLDAAKVLGIEIVPCTIIADPEFDDDAENFQMVRHNVIHGKMSPQKFLKLYESLTPKYADDVLQDAFGFADDEEFRKLVQQTAAGLPKEMQVEFKEAAKEIKTIDGLAKLLNEMFAKYGSTLDTGFMVIDYGGKDSVWIRISKKTFKSIVEVGELCRERACTMDDLFGGVLQSIAKGKIDLDTSHLQEVVIPEALEGLPTLENLKNYSGAE